MWEPLTRFWEEHGLLLSWLGGASVGVLVVSVVGLVMLIVMAPADSIKRYFDAQDNGLAPDDWRRRHPVLRWSLVVVKNVAGAVLAVAGLAMLVLPGQGLITLVVALLLLDIPGKRRLERRVLRSPRLLRPMNRLRRRFGREELVVGAEGKKVGGRR